MFNNIIQHKQYKNGKTTENYSTARPPTVTGRRRRRRANRPRTYAFTSRKIPFSEENGTRFYSAFRRARRRAHVKVDFEKTPVTAFWSWTADRWRRILKTVNTSRLTNTTS